MTTTEVRRIAVLEHARQVIMRNGLAATSLRRISREGGYTTGVLTHYFADKRELLAACLEHTMTSWLDGAERTLAAAATAEESVRAWFEIAVPFEPEQHGEWRLWLEFCASAVGDAQRAERLIGFDKRWDAITASAFARWHEEGLVRAELTVESEARLLVRLVDGLGLRALMSGDWDEARRHLAAALRTLGMPTPVAEAALLSPRTGTPA